MSYEDQVRRQMEEQYRANVNGSACPIQDDLDIELGLWSGTKSAAKKVGRGLKKVGRAAKKIGSAVKSAAGSTTGSIAIPIAAQAGLHPAVVAGLASASLLHNVPKLIRSYRKKK